MKNGLNFLETLVKTTGAVVGVIVLSAVILIVGVLAIVC